jgi:predicted permease
VLLAAIAAVPSLLITQAASGVFQRYLYMLLIRQGCAIQPVTPDWRVFLFTAALALGAGILLGLAPALESTRTELAGRLNAQRRTSRIRQRMLAVQVAASLVLLLVAGLFVRGAQRIHRVDPGFDTAHAIDVRADGAKERLAARLRADSRFESVSEALRTPLSGWPIFLQGKVDGRIWPLGYNYVESSYFETLGIPLRRGRIFTPLEARTRAALAVVSDETARLLWPGQDPIGKLIDVPAPKPGERFTAGKYEVIGVVANVISGVLYLGKDYTSIYLPAAPGDARNGSLIARGRDTSPATLAGIRTLCAETEGVNGCEPVALGEMAWRQRFPHLAASGISVALGAMALIMTCIGLWGLVACAVVERTREIGIRMALGAAPASVLRSMLKQGGRQVALGIAIGLPCALGISRIMLGVMAPNTIEAFDAGVYLAVPVLLSVVALLAAYLPARRATRVDPMAALRQE